MLEKQVGWIWLNSCEIMSLDEPPAATFDRRDTDIWLIYIPRTFWKWLSNAAVMEF